MKTVMLTRVQAEKLWVKEHTRNGDHVIPSLLRIMPATEGAEYLLHTGAKLYRLRKGPKPFMVSGYAYDGSDVDLAIEGIL
jgi:hypothetical protein